MVDTKRKLNGRPDNIVNGSVMKGLTTNNIKSKYIIIIERNISKCELSIFEISMSDK